MASISSLFFLKKYNYILRILSVGLCVFICVEVRGQFTNPSSLLVRSGH